MIDSFGRNIEYMRISVTDRCNLRCKYCMPEDLPEISHSEILRYEEILEVCRAAIRLGIRHFRVTGGEPLVRRGCLDFLRLLKDLPGAGQIMLTTNGVLLESCVPALRDMGIDGVNVSLDTLDRGVFQSLTGTDALDQVMRGIEASLAAGLRVKINCVLMRGINDEEFCPITHLAARYPLDVRFIESMPIGEGSKFSPVPEEELISRLQKEYPDIAQDCERRGFGPARYYSHHSLQGEIGFISAMSHCFCETCNRVRLTSDGLMKTCLYYGQSTDLKPILRGDMKGGALEDTIRDTVARKQERHAFHQGIRSQERRNMSQIGG